MRRGVLQAKPVDENSVLLSWQTVEESGTYILYRGEHQDSLKQVRAGIQETEFKDTGLAKGQTYWYALASSDSNGQLSRQSALVSVVPTQRPRLRGADYSPPNQLLLQFDKPMGISATHAGRYLLKKQEAVESYAPISAILDRSGQRVVLTFSPAVFQTGNHYQIEAMKLLDIYGAELDDDARALTILLPAPTLAETIIYPNPVECNQVTFDKLPLGTHIYIYDVAGNCIASLDRTERERDKKVWHLSGISSGVYVYVLESETDRRIGKLSVIR